MVDSSAGATPSVIAVLQAASRRTFGAATIRFLTDVTVDSLAEEPGSTVNTGVEGSVSAASGVMWVRPAPDGPEMIKVGDEIYRRESDSPGWSRFSADQLAPDSPMLEPFNLEPFLGALYGVVSATATTAVGIVTVNGVIDLMRLATDIPVVNQSYWAGLAATADDPTDVGFVALISRDGCLAAFWYSVRAGTTITQRRIQLTDLGAPVTDRPPGQFKQAAAEFHDR
ncbi:hypothetical protein SAMN05421812_1118 [Asanoa hainanensis]|uniref:Uncharacterized protein n=1 Tax=Asanoa hainanensis TaxID=560556 RepID=A0A239NUE1_9ACTN|nr:hypothetical protein [Asanoa hainanensis]SNT58487.1 hypothetical protein SAMN05421812_1118 [Asanoa hainanensis]